MKIYLATILYLGWAAASLAVPENLALNKPYTLSPPPNYPYCTDPGDKTQLTDGIYSEGYFWTQIGTVGWMNVAPVQCVIDLGQVEPICGASWSTAARGAAGVNWPESVLIFASEDRKTWTFLGDLCELGTIEESPPEDGRYATFRYASDRMQGRGRYVCVVAAARPYCLVDEIEVWRGPEAWLSGELSGERTDNPKRLYETSRVRLGVSSRLRSDLKSIFAQAEFLGLKEIFADLRTTMHVLQGEISTAAQGVPDDFKTILPYNELHTRILSLNASVLRAAGVLQPLVWQGNRWDPLTLSAIPPQGSEADSVTLDLMRGEAFNITNPNSSELDLKLSVYGMPDGLNLELREVLFTDTLSGQPIAAALRPLVVDAAGICTFRVPAGCTRQVWLACNRPSVAAQTYAGEIRVTSIDATFSDILTLYVRVRNLDFPEQPALHVGGWDYVQGAANYYRAPGNIDANLTLMRSMYVDSPWATKAVFPKGAQFDENGQLINTSALDFSVWDAWVKRWQGARNYCVYFRVGRSFHGEAMGTTRFDIKVGAWLTAWVNHMERQGLKAEQMVILLVDEPRHRRQDAILVAWAKAIRAARLGVVLFVDPTYVNPLQGDPAMFAAHDVLCPHTPMMVEQGAPFRKFYRQQREAGKTLWLYSCRGPAKLMDPITYHRAQAWLAFQIGAKGSFYWAFGCGGGIGDSWRAYSQTGVAYSPYFVGPTSVLEGKHSEAIREGVQDYEYLCMLREQADKVRVSGKNSEWLQCADDLLDRGVTEAMATVSSAAMFWHVAKNRSSMDNVRIQVLDALEAAPEGWSVAF